VRQEAKMSEPKVVVAYEPPTPAEYLALRRDGGLKVFSTESASLGLAHSLFCVTLRADGTLVGMGRVIGDAGCFCQIVDIVVSTSLRGHGLGKMVLSEINAFVQHHLPADTYVSLLADVPADALYRQFGFEETGPRTIGMALRGRYQVSPV